MRSTRHSKPLPRSSSSASPNRGAAEQRLEARLRERLGSEFDRWMSVVKEVLLAEGWTPPQPGPSRETRSELPPAKALFEAARSGGVDAVRRMIDLPAESLRHLIGELGYDPSRRARKWRDRDRLIAFIADETVKRVRRNRAFLSDMEPENTRAEPASAAPAGRVTEDEKLSGESSAASPQKEA